MWFPFAPSLSQAHTEHDVIETNSYSETKISAQFAAKPYSYEIIHPGRLPLGLEEEGRDMTGSIYH